MEDSVGKGATRSSFWWTRRFFNWQFQLVLVSWDPDRPLRDEQSVLVSIPNTIERKFQELSDSLSGQKHSPSELTSSSIPRAEELMRVARNELTVLSDENFQQVLWVPGNVCGPLAETSMPIDRPDPFG